MFYRRASQFGLPAFIVFLASFGSAVHANGLSEYRVTASQGDTVSIDLMENNDQSSYNASTLYIYSPPNNGYLTRLTGSVIEYTHYSGTDDTDSFSYVVADYAGVYQAPVQVYVDIDSDFSNGTRTEYVQVDEGGAVTIDLLQDMPYANSSTLHIVQAPNHGYLTPFGGSTMQYTNYPGAGTTDQFSFSVASNTGIYSEPIFVSLNIGGGGYNASPSTNSPSTNAAPVYTSNNAQAMAAAPIDTNTTAGNGTWWTPRASDNLNWQIQLQGDINIIPGVQVYAVDSEVSQASIDAAKATGAKLLCYISAGSAEEWRSDFSDFPNYVIGNSYDGWPGEFWLDIRNINALAPIMQARIDTCAAKGFDAIDADNVNAFINNSGFYITRQDSINYIRWLANESHIRGMAFSLKNAESLAAELIDDVDMMQTEGCFVWGNCENASRMSAANKPVFAIEYEDNVDRNTFQNACNVAAEYNFAMIYRDRALTPFGIYEACY